MIFIIRCSEGKIIFVFIDMVYLCVRFIVLYLFVLDNIMLYVYIINMVLFVVDLYCVLIIIIY
jgi:hypothetical protein